MSVIHLARFVCDLCGYQETYEWPGRPVDWVETIQEWNSQIVHLCPQCIHMFRTEIESMDPSLLMPLNTILENDDD